MTQTSDSLPEWLYYFPALNSTNNYAMQRIEDGMARDGQVVWAGRQTAGKGQRGKSWVDDPGNLKFSLIHKPGVTGDRLFQLNMQVTVTLCEYLEKILPTEIRVSVKWPNDIFLADKKTCGILIENIFKGANWTFAVVGIGLNVNQIHFPAELQQATSLRLACGQNFDLQTLLSDIRAGLMNELIRLPHKSKEVICRAYNAFLYQRDRSQLFERTSDGKMFEAYVTEVEADGQLVLLTPTGVEKYGFGMLKWIF